MMGVRKAVGVPNCGVHPGLACNPLQWRRLKKAPAPRRQSAVGNRL